MKQRLNAARMIRSLLDEKTYVIAVEHDLSVLDYLSDFICCLYGVPSVYGVVMVPSPVRDGECNFVVQGRSFAHDSVLLRYKVRRLGSNLMGGTCTNTLSRSMFLDGYSPSENMRFREDSLTFKIAETAEEEVQDRIRSFEYGAMKKTLGGFTLEIEPGQFSDSEIIVFLGENGTGKTT